MQDDVKSQLVNQGCRFKNLEEFDSWRGKDLLNIAEYIFMNSSYAVLGHSMLLLLFFILSNEKRSKMIGDVGDNDTRVMCG